MDQRYSDVLDRLNSIYGRPNKGLSVHDFLCRQRAIYKTWCDPSMRKYLRKYAPDAGQDLQKELLQARNDVEFMKSLFPEHWKEAIDAIKAIEMCRWYHKPWLTCRYSLRCKTSRPKRYA